MYGVAAVLAAALMLMSCSAAQAPASKTTASGTPEASAAPARVLVFSKTAGFRHDSIPAAVAAIRELGTDAGFDVDATEDAAAFTADNLARYRAVVFMSTTGDVLDAAQERQFEAYIRAGGGYVGVHAAADTEYSWPFYAELVGAHFASHPKVQGATLAVEDRKHPATAHLSSTWTRTDEWYNFRANPRARVRVLVTLEEKSYEGGAMGADHPIAWCRSVGDGRSFYTGGGHSAESFAERDFRAHLLGGIRYSAGLAPAECAPR